MFDIKTQSPLVAKKSKNFLNSSRQSALMQLTYSVVLVMGMPTYGRFHFFSWFLVFLTFCNPAPYDRALYTGGQTSNGSHHFEKPWWRSHSSNLVWPPRKHLFFLNYLLGTANFNQDSGNLWCRCPSEMGKVATCSDDFTVSLIDYYKITLATFSVCMLLQHYIISSNLL